MGAIGSGRAADPPLRWTMVREERLAGCGEANYFATIFIFAGD